MADHIQHGRLPPTTPNPQFFTSRLSTTFHPYFFTITHHSLYFPAHPHHGKPTSTRPKHRWIPPPRENLQLFKSRHSTTFHGYLCRKTSPRGCITTNTVPQNTVPQNSVPQNTVPQNTVPQNTAPQNTVPQSQDVLKLYL